MSKSAERAQMPANSIFRNTTGKGSKQATDGPPGFLPEDRLRKICEKHYNQPLPIMAENVHQEKLQSVQTRLTYGESSRKNSQKQEINQLSKSESCDKKRRARKRRKPSLARRQGQERLHTIGRKEKIRTLTSKTQRCVTPEHDRGGHWKSKSKKQRSTNEEDLSQPWLCEDTSPFTPRIRNFEVPKRTHMPTNVKMYDGTGDRGDHLKIFQTAAKIERWVMPTCCHMFNSTLIGSARDWFDTLPPESIDSYVVLQKAFLGNFLQQKKYIKDPIEIHHVSTEAFMERFKAESMHVNGAPECMRVSGFMHGITNPYLIKRLNEKNPKVSG
ncbi:hypothetical protein Tco_0245678 [Tanacetum coccineum]